MPPSPCSLRQYADADNNPGTGDACVAPTNVFASWEGIIMKPKWLDLATAAIVSAPALIYIFYTQTFRGEYYYSTYLIAGLVFWSASILLSSPIARIRWFMAARWRMVLFYYLALTMAWLLALGVMLALSLTPLCVGQDNGDGSNSLPICVVQALLVAFFTSAPVLLGCAPTAIAAGLLHKTYATET
ncbi:MAG: hypothetical protein ACYCZF_15065 [Anaerolineae bacterium]